MTDHERWADAAGAYVLGALPDRELRSYESHLAECPICREEVDELRPAAEAIPMSSPPMAPPAELKGRIMAEVEREAALLASAGPAADRPAAPRRRRRRPLLAGWRLAPAAAALLIAGVLAGVVIAGGEDTRTIQATIDPQQLQGASAELRVEDGEATLVADGLPEPDGSFQVWIKRPGVEAPEPSVLFLPRNGSAAAAVPQSGDDAEAVLVTFEPKDGSDEPSAPPALTVPL
jgi:anti-sigma factor RsiW